MKESYKIVRRYLNKRPRTIMRGLTLEEAKAHCKDPQTSYTTARGKNAYSRRVGPWFDGYEKE